MDHLWSIYFQISCLFLKAKHLNVPVIPPSFLTPSFAGVPNNLVSWTPWALPSHHTVNTHFLFGLHMWAPTCSHFLRAQRPTSHDSRSIQIQRCKEQHQDFWEVLGMSRKTINTLSCTQTTSAERGTHISAIVTSQLALVEKGGPCLGSQPQTGNYLFWTHRPQIL